MIDPDRDYLLSKVIDLNETLNEYAARERLYEDRLKQLSEANSRLTEANASALATAEGWKNEHSDVVKECFEVYGKYHDLLTAARRQAGWRNSKSFLRYLGLPTD